MDVKQYTFPSLVKGLSTARPASEPNPGFARVLDNWICTTNGIRVRGGKRKHATLGSSQVHSFMQYYGLVNKLFAVSNGTLYDVGSPVSPITVPASILSGLGAGLYSHTGFSTAGGQFIIAVNGTSSHLHYDGTTWTQPNDITGVTSINFSAVWQWKSRLFFAVKGKPQIAYLPLNNKAGVASTIDFSAILERGGEFIAGSTWSTETGNGPQDLNVFWTSNGEVLVYSGTDPSVAAQWSIVGRYDIPKPLGKNAFTRAGGDLIICTVEGPVPLSQVAAKDPAALQFATLTREIKPDWDLDVDSYSSNKNWTIVKWPERNITILGVPQGSTAAASNAHCWVINSTTGAISRLLNYDIQSLAVFNGKCFFGSNNGLIYEADTTGSDDGSIYYCNAVSWFDDCGSPAISKQYSMSRPTFMHGTPFKFNVSAHVNYSVSQPVYLGAEVDEQNSNVWDIGLWDVAVWRDNSVSKKPKYEWRALGANGFAVALGISISISNTLSPVIELGEIPMTIEEGNAITSSSTASIIERDAYGSGATYVSDDKEYKVTVIAT